MALIMIADDDATFVNVVKLYLEARGHQVVSVSDGTNASIKAQDWKPHLIVMDIQMPGGYGTTAYRSLEMAGITATTPIIFVSAVPAEKAAKVLPSTPKTRFFTKPLDLPKLEAAIKELLSS